MKLRRSNLEVFGLSFLDVISCAFGAVIMLVLVSKNSLGDQNNDIANIVVLLNALSQAKAVNEELQSQTADKRNALKQDVLILQQAQEKKAAMEKRLTQVEDEIQKSSEDRKVWDDVLESKKRSALDKKESQKVVEVGGIPVDSEYVIFIVDISPSMKEIKDKVSQVIGDILASHPEVKGFQIINADGDYILSNTAGRWRPDTPATRRDMLSLLFNGSSYSDPIGGLEEALSTYARKTSSLSIYVFGDDYNAKAIDGSGRVPYDAVIDRLDRLNTDSTGRRLARVHAIGFRNPPHRYEQYAIFMREVTRRNRGTFIGLP